MFRGNKSLDGTGTSQENRRFVPYVYPFPAHLLFFFSCTFFCCPRTTKTRRASVVCAPASTTPWGRGSPGCRCRSTCRRPLAPSPTRPQHRGARAVVLLRLSNLQRRQTPLQKGCMACFGRVSRIFCCWSGDGSGEPSTCRWACMPVSVRLSWVRVVRVFSGRSPMMSWCCACSRGLIQILL